MKHVAEPAAERVVERRATHHPPPIEDAPPVPVQRGVAEPGVRSVPPLSVRHAVLLQRQAGNRATAQLLAQRRRATPPAAGHRGTTPAAPPVAEPAPASPRADVGSLPVQRLVAGRGGPAQDPKFTALKRDVKSKQQTLGKHPPPKAEADAAQGAAKPPQDDKEAQGKAANAEKMNAAKPGDFDKAAFIKAVNDAIAKQAPKNLDEADKFGDSGKAEAVKGEVQGKVGAGKENSAKAIDTATKAPPDTGAAKDKPVTPLRPDQPPPKPGAPDPSQAVPDKTPPAATDFSAGPKQVDQQMADAQVTEEQLAKSNEPEFTGALKEKKEGEQHAATAPGQVRAEEAKTLSGAKAQAAQAGAAAMTTMAADRTKAGQEVSAGKEGAKSEDEKKREQVTAKLQTVFDATKKDVEDILNGLDKKVDDKFSAGEKAARDAFTADYTRRMDAYKDKRYSGITGKLRWVDDLFSGLPDEVNVFYEQARDGYLKRMRQVISDVADVIGTELNRAKARIATGRNELQAEVKKLPADLQALGKEVAGEFSSKFDELTQAVDDKGTALVDTLASKYTEALKAVDEEIASEKEKNKGLIAKAIDAVKGVIDTILKLKDLLLGVLAKAAQAVVAIIKDPIGFLGKVVSAVGAGLKAFMANIANHLQKGLVSWLLGAAAKAGLQLPEKFDIKGILMLIASLLGLTWAAIRGRVVSKGVPEQAMGAVESSVPIAQKIKDQGIGGIWEELKERVGDLKATLLGKIADYLIPTVLIAGITWIVSLLNPASAFIKACKAIIDIVTFIVERGAQIVAFVNAVLDAVIAIAGGGAGGVPALIETALATALPVLIGFLAALLGIGGLADKVKKLFQSLSKPVMKAVDWIVDKIAALGKKLWNKLRSRSDRRTTGRDTGARKDDKRQVLDAALTESEKLLTDRKPKSEIASALPAIRDSYGLKRLELMVSSRDGVEIAHVIGTINPTDRTGKYPVDEGGVPGEVRTPIKIYEQNKISGRSILTDVREAYQRRYEDRVRQKGKLVAIIRFESDPGDTPAWKARMEASRISARQKVRNISALGFGVQEHVLPANTPPARFVDLLARYNQDPACTGLIVQLPAPPVFASYVSAIAPEKDIDAILRGQSPYPVGATSEGISRVAEPFLAGKPTVAVVGSRGFVGQGVVKLVRKHDVRLIQLDMGDELSRVREANVVISVTGSQGILGSEHLLPEHRLVVDSGFVPQPDGGAFGDVQPSASGIPRRITPVPGGIGPVEMAVLLERLIRKEVEPDLPPWRVVGPSSSSEG